MTVAYYEEDANLENIAMKTVGMIGYGSLSRPAAKSLRQQGIVVLVAGTQEDITRAEADGFTIMAVEELTNQSDILICSMPDEMMTAVYMKGVSAHLRRGHTLIFDSAYNIAFGFIEPPPFVDVGLIAPRTSSGAAHREDGRQPDYPLCYVSVWQDSSRNAWDTVLATALGMGALKSGAIEVSVEQEAELSLFIQQALLPIFHHIMMTASAVLTEQGYPPEAALTDLYLSGKFADYFQNVVQQGLLDTIKTSSLTGQFGTLSRLDRFHELKLERLMEITLHDIREGNFAREWMNEYADGHPRLNRMMQQQEALDIWEMEKQTLEMRDTGEELYY